MDLKIKDVAELLNVSETTIRRWLGDGKIPAYRLHHQYRFSRTEIEDWLMGHKLGVSTQHSVGAFHEHLQKNTHTIVEEESLTSEDNSNSTQTSGGSKQFSLYRAIHKGGVYHNIPGGTKEEIIHAVMKKIASGLNMDADAVAELLLDREELQSTGLNNGIAIPHTRDFLLKAHFDSVTVVFPETPIMYDSLDGKPVDTLFFLFACDDRRHLHLLAKIAHLSSLKETLEFFKTKPSQKALLNYVKAWEERICQPQEV